MWLRAKPLQVLWVLSSASLRFISCVLAMDLQQVVCGDAAHYELLIRSSVMNTSCTCQMQVVFMLGA